MRRLVREGSALKPITRENFRWYHVVLIALILWLISFFTLGFVSLVSPLTEWFMASPLLIKVAGIGIFASFAFILYSFLRYGRRLRRGGAGYGLLLLIVFSLIYAGGYAAMLNNSPSEIEVISLDHAINTTSTRLIPLHTAYAYAISMLQTPTHTLYEEETYIYYDSSGNIIYNWVIEPEGFWNEISRDAEGAVFVNGSVFPPEVKIFKEDLKWGIHKLIGTPFFLDNLWREIKLRAGLGVRVLMDCNVEVYRNGSIYIIIPLASWKTFLTTSVPYVVGYAVISPDGAINIVSVDEARKNDLFRGVPLVPDVIARRWAEIYRFYTGLIPVILYHNTFTIRDVGTNPQPYLMTDSKGNLFWVFVAEPPGETASAKYIFYVNASDTHPHIMIYELPRPAIGISRIESLIKQAHPTYDWGEFNIAEPMPLILNSTLYWKVSVITLDGRGVVSVDLVDTEKNEVISIQPGKKLTAEDIVNKIKKIYQETPEGNESVQSIIQRIKELKDIIQKQQAELQKLYEELEELEKILADVLSNLSVGGGG